MNDRDATCSWDCTRPFPHEGPCGQWQRDEHGHMQAAPPAATTTHVKAERFITRVAWVGKGDDPCSVASQAAGIMRGLLDERDDLLATLKKIADETVRHFTGCRCAVCIARAAIAKAEGR